MTKTNQRKLMLLSSMFLLVGCSTPDYDSPDDYIEQIDTSKTQLYVYNFNGGFGSDWLVKVKERYEQLHKDDVYETGKKGIQIYINPQKTNAQYYSASNVLDNRDEIFFQEYGYYYSLKAQGIFSDMTEVLTSPNPYENGRTIESKLTEQQKNFYKIDGKYFAIPHYNGFSGITYNIDLFKDEGYYFLDEPRGTNLENYFVDSYELDKDYLSSGPDGIKGTDDDGLPRTYEEFFQLCEYIYTGGNVPLIWAGTNYKDYLTYFMQELVAEYEGKDQTILNYSFDGTATDLGSFVNNNFVLDSSNKTITDTNGYELSRQAGKYYALEFIKRICEESNYYYEKSFNAAFSHLDAQDYFLWSTVKNGVKPVAMLIEGIWWENESLSTTKEIATQKGTDYGMLGSKHNFGYMPLPKATTAKFEDDKLNNRKYTVNDYINSIAFIKSNIADWKKPIAVDFLQFCNTDESLVEFTQVTNTPKALNYSMNEEQLSKMSSYGKSVMKIKQDADVVYPISNSSKYINNQEYFGVLNIWKSNLSGTTKSFPANAFYENHTSVKDYFNGMYQFNLSYWSSLK